MQNDAPVARIIARSANPTVPLITGIAGLAAMYTFWPLGVGLIVLALCVNKKIWVCGNCERLVEKGSKYCPECGALLFRRIPARYKTAGSRPFFERPLGITLLLVGSLLAVGGGLWFLLAHASHSHH